jgi:hypothetical protein
MVLYIGIVHSQNEPVIGALKRFLPRVVLTQKLRAAKSGGGMKGMVTSSVG